MKELNQILFYSLLAVFSFCFYGCGEEDDDLSQKEFSVQFVNGSEKYLDENGQLKIAFTYRAEEKPLSFIANNDWIIELNNNEWSENLSDWLTVTAEDGGGEVEISDTEYGMKITGKGSDKPYTIKLKTEETEKDYVAGINFYPQNNNQDYVIQSISSLNIIKSSPLVENHDMNIGYAGGIMNLNNGLQYNIDEEWIKTITTSDPYGRTYLKISPNETGVERKVKVPLSYNLQIDTLYITQTATKVSKQVNVSTAGTLQDQLTAEEKYQVTDLVVTGNLNGDNIRYLREMGGKDYAGSETKGKLTNLDLSEANIVSGGRPYYAEYSNYSTEDNLIGDYMFSGLNLVSIKLPNSVIEIESYAFQDCLSLSSVKLPSNWKAERWHVGSHIFSNCISLTSIEIPNEVTIISSYMFRTCISLANVKLSENIKEIDNYAFSGCSKLSSIEIPDKVETIGERAFVYCTSLKEITFPTSITTLGKEVFSGCTAMTQIRCLAVEPPLLSSAIGIEETATLYVPKASLAKYKDAAVWRNFKNIVGE